MDVQPTNAQPNSDKPNTHKTFNRWFFIFNEFWLWAYHSDLNKSITHLSSICDLLNVELFIVRSKYELCIWDLYTTSSQKAYSHKRW